MRRHGHSPRRLRLRDRGAGRTRPRCLRLRQGLAARGHNVTLVTLSKTLPSSESIGLDYGIREVALRTPALPLHLGAEAEAFFSGPAGAADVYHFHSSAARHCLAARRLSAPYVVTPPHGAYLPANLNHRRAWNLAFRLLLGRAYLTGAAAVHAITAIEGAAWSYTAGRGAWR